MAGHILGTSLGGSGTGWVLPYLSYTTFLQLSITVIPDTVAIVAWTVDTSLKRTEGKGLTPNVTPKGPRLRAATRRAGGTLDARFVHTPAPRHGEDV